MELLGLFANQAAIALDLLQRARRAQEVLADQGEAAVLARLAQKLEERRAEDEDSTAAEFLAALEKVL
jgi:16S rRNA C1402 N4-methylase RsmH